MFILLYKVTLITCALAFSSFPPVGFYNYHFTADLGVLRNLGMEHMVLCSMENGRGLMLLSRE